MKKELVILPDGYARRTAIFVLFIVAIITLLLWHGGIFRLKAVAAFSFTGIVAVGALLSFEPRIRQDQQRVVRVWQLGGLLPIWRRAYSFGSFQGVQQVYIPEVQHNTWQVGLLSTAGKFLMVT